MAPTWFRLAARVRGVAMPLGFVLFFGGLVAGFALPDDWVPGGIVALVTLVGFVTLGVGAVLTYLPVTPHIAPREVAAPVAGRWTALNSPWSKVPSHGLHAYGQTFAIDLVYEPAEGTRPAFGEGPAFRPPEDFPAFGEPVLAPADGRVVAVRDGARDHRSRSTWGAYAYLILEGFVRELTGPGRVIGNCVVIDLGDGAYAAAAHLQQGSARVRPGQPVRRGEPIGRCGNSGNSTEPHVHFQLMDAPRPAFAAGLPFVFADVRIGESPPGSGVPANEQVMVAGRPAFTRS
jgi:murein DD-endopeptidase MepM/ murein hydrolase activator NlpD